MNGEQWTVKSERWMLLLSSCCAFCCCWFRSQIDSLWSRLFASFRSLFLIQPTTSNKQVLFCCLKRAIGWAFAGAKSKPICATTTTMTLFASDLFFRWRLLLLASLCCSIGAKERDCCIQSVNCTHTANSEQKTANKPSAGSEFVTRANSNPCRARCSLGFNSLSFGFFFLISTLEEEKKLFRSHHASA